MVKLIILVLFSLPCLALEGMIIVLEAPLFQAPFRESLIIQHSRKGDMMILYPSKESNFHRTIDRNGNEAYVLKKHLKLITNDEEELADPLASFQPDLTDYRIQEPLPENFPFHQKIKYRGALFGGPFLSENQSYQYGQAPRFIQPSPHIQLVLQLTKPYFVDKRNPRLYWGGLFRFSYQGKEVQFFDGTKAYERDLLLTLGPVISYDLFRQDRHRFVISGGVGIDFVNSHLVEIGKELHSFRGITLGPLFSFQYQRIRILKKMDFIIGTTANLFIFQKLKSVHGKQGHPLWNNQKLFQRDLSLHLGLTTGLQYSY